MRYKVQDHTTKLKLVDDEEPTSEHLTEAEIVQLVTEEEEEEEEEDADEEAEEDSGPPVAQCVSVHSALNSW